MTRWPGRTRTPGLSSTMPSTATRRAAIQRLGVAARAQAGAGDQLGDPLTLGRACGAHRSAAAATNAAISAVSPGLIAVFGVPLHAEAEAPPRVLDRLDHAVLGAGADHDALADPLGRLVMGAVDRQASGPGDPVQQRARHDRDLMAGLGARIGLLVGQRARHGIRDVLDQRAAQHDVEQLLAAADAEHRQVAVQRASRDRPLEPGAALLEPDGGVPVAAAVQRGVDVEGARR